jgi:hypothetical protein
MHDRITFRPLAVAAAAALLGACASTVPVADDVVLRHFTPSEIVVADAAVGVFRAANGCVYLEYGAGERWRAAALFPPGTSLTPGREAIRLPDGRDIAFGKQVAVVFEAPPVVQDETCGPKSVWIIGLRRG